MLGPIQACPWCGDTRGCDCQERVDCTQAGQPGHRQCGWCSGCNLPKFQCCCTEE